MTPFHQAIFICLAITVVGIFMNVFSSDKHPRLAILSLFLMSGSMLVAFGIVIGNILST